MKRVCFLSTDNLDGYTFDDDLAIAPLEKLGWRVDTISWHNKGIDWNDYEAVVIRTTWDYQHHADEFIGVLETIQSSKARLENPLDIVRWNLSKTYLREMNERGCPIVPTLWEQEYSGTAFESWQNDLKTDELIIKPTISATAQYTYKLKTFDPTLTETFASREFMIQPFMPSIVTEGEYSLFYFGGEFSHAIKKAPKQNDFRVQEEHGGIITAVEPEPSMRAAADRAIETVGQKLLYARVDLIRDRDGEFLLMELELIEPALYFRMDDRAPLFFAEQFDRRMNEL